MKMNLLNAFLFVEMDWSKIMKNVMIIIFLTTMAAITNFVQLKTAGPVQEHLTQFALKHAAMATRSEMKNVMTESQAPSMAVQT